MRSAPGDLLVRRHFRRGDELALAMAARVVRDDPRGLLLWVAEGAPGRRLVAVDGRDIRDMPFAEWVTLPKQLTAWQWRASGMLMLMPPGAAHSVWWFWRGPERAFSSWYVNLERPAVRWRDGTLAGVDTVDHDLDIVVAPDGSWQWKDEHELLERAGQPEHYWVPDPAAVRAEGERLCKLVESGEFPFDGSWCDFRPDPRWRVPADLPSGWDRPRAG